MHLTRVALVALSIALLAGCGSGTTDPAKQDEPSSAKPRQFTGVDAKNYGDAYTICSVFSIRKVASDLGIHSTDPVTVAQAYAAQLKPAYRQAPFEGCLDALLGDPPKVAPN